jgi:hypothetical protein
VKGLNMKLPDLADLIADFEKDDDVVKQASEAIKIYKAEMKVKGYEVEPRYDIKDVKNQKIAHLDTNITN